MKQISHLRHPILSQSYVVDLKNDLVKMAVQKLSLIHSSKASALNHYVSKRHLMFLIFATQQTHPILIQLIQPNCDAILQEIRWWKKRLMKVESMRFWNSRFDAFLMMTAMRMQPVCTIQRQTRESLSNSAPSHFEFSCDTWWRVCNCVWNFFFLSFAVAFGNLSH